MRKMATALACVAIACGTPATASADKPKPVVIPAGYDHAKYAPKPDILRQFAAFTVSFDSKDDDDGDGKEDLRRVPEWVAQHVKRFTGPCIDTDRRPSTWLTDAELFRSGVAPGDASYEGSGFDRGHLAAKLLSARISPAAEWNSHTVLNAVPQRPRFNQQIWRNLEDITGAWAQIYGEVWIVQGPIFERGASPATIGDKGEPAVAVPDALFKVVIRNKTAEEKAMAPTANKDDPEILSFLYPQLGPRYYGKHDEFSHERFLTTLDEVEKLTGLTFLGSLNEDARKRMRWARAQTMWLIASPVVDPGIVLFVEGCSDLAEKR